MARLLLALWGIARSSWILDKIYAENISVMLNQYQDDSKWP